MRLVETRGFVEESPLDVRGVTAAYGNEPVLWDVSFRVPEGKLVAIVGPNGAGKTTLLKVVIGLMEPAAGKATVFGRPFAKASRKARQQQAAYQTNSTAVSWPIRKLREASTTA